MLYLNAYEIEEARNRYAHHPILGTATAQLEELAQWTNRVSDGWAYWPKPCRAARKLQEMIGSTRAYLDDPEREDVTAEQYAAALRPIKAFRTRYAKAQGVDPSALFTIYDVPQPMRTEAADDPSTTPQEIARLLRGEVTVELVATSEARADDLTTGYVVVHGSDWTLYADSPTVYRNGEVVYQTEEVPTS